MKKSLLSILLLISFCSFGQIDKVIPARPNPPKLVNDFTGTLKQSEIRSLEEKLYRYDDSTSNQIAIVIVSTTDIYPVNDVAFEIGRRWGVGNKDKNNGIVLLVAKDDRKVTIQTGYGLEGAIPDITAKAIIDNDIKPNFKKGDYYEGLDKATDDIIKAAAGEYKAPKGYSNKRAKGIGIGAIIFFIILIILIAGRGNRGGGTMMSRRGYGDFGTGWILGSLLGGGSGGGGGWSGGGSGGGGFGGFGGGSFGGGGASGSW